MLYSIKELHPIKAFKSQIMETSNLLNLLLTVHITGLTIAGGLSVANFFAIQKFSKVLANGESTIIVAAILPQPSRFFWIGLLMLLISGAMMMHIAYTAFMMQIWFQLKLGLILLIAVNGIIIDRKMAGVRSMILNENERSATPESITVFLGKAMVLSGLQLLFFLMIFILAVFRFN
jgi:hypothetical protein